MKKIPLLPVVLIAFSFYAATQFKEPLYGLACRDFKRIQSTDDEVIKNMHTIIVQLNWSDIQLTEDGSIERDNAADRAIKWVNAFNEKYGTDIGLKIRLYTGMNSPQWIMNKAGSFGIQDHAFPKFWEDAFIKAFAEVQSKLAAIYDDVPVVREIVDGGTSTKTAENFIRPFGNSPNATMINEAFRKAGYTAQADSIAIVKSFDAMKVWKKTLVSVCFSDWKTLDKNGNVVEDVSRTIPFIKMFIDEFGKQAVVGNNGLRPGTGHHGNRWQEGGDMFAIYQYFKRIHDEKGIQIYFQTAKDERIGNLQDAINDGIAYGASYIELPGAPRNYMQDLPLSAMAVINKKLKENIKYFFCSGL
ncbi:MAG: hypothetical protein ABI861_01700 [Panacibacter sp.]